MKKTILITSILLLVQQSAFAGKKDTELNLNSPQYRIADNITKQFCSAAEHQNLPMMNLFIQQGADINNENCDPYKATTPLMVAVSSHYTDHITVFNYLLDHGANVNYKTKNGETALMYLLKDPWESFHGTVPFLNQALPALLEHGADVNAENKAGDTPLIYLAASGYSQFSLQQFINSMNLLIKNGANINHQDHSGLTALMITAKGCGIESTKLLLASGADSTIKTKTGDSAMTIAAKKASEQNSSGPCNEIVGILQNPKDYINKTIDSTSNTGGSSIETNGNQPTINPLQGITKFLSNLNRIIPGGQ